MAKTAALDTHEPGSIEERLVAFAEQVGRLTGLAKAKADAMLDRTHVTAQLTRIRDEASALLSQLQPESSSKPSRPAPKAAKALSARSAAAGGRRAPARQRGVKHSRQEIAKAKMASTMRKRGRG